jgi:hypothetical protein
MNLYPQLEPASEGNKGPAIDWPGLARRWLRRLMVVVVVIAALTVIWRFFYPIYSWRQKTTVSVSTPQGVVTGASVVAVTWGDSPDILPDPPHVFHHSNGEAVVVELPGKRYLFALIGNAEFTPLKVFAKDKFPKQSPYATDSLLPAAGEVAEHLGQTRSLTPDQYPMLVTFGDIDDPASVRRVDPTDFTASFGPGHSLHAITMSITSEPVTEGRIRTVLSWLEEYYDIHLDGQRIETVTARNRLANSLAAGDFKTERD